MGFTPQSQGGTHIVERNLTRVTIAGRGALLPEHGPALPPAQVARALHSLPHAAWRGLHHVTCVCSDAQRTLDFYRDRLGFTLVKKTVNFDDPHSYHLYFGDEVGEPGTLLTFFEWPRAERGPARPRHARVDRARDARGRRGDGGRGSRRAAAAALSRRETPRLRDVVGDRQPRPLCRPLRRRTRRFSSPSRSRSRR